MRSRIPLIAAGLAMALGGGAAVAVLATPAQAATICEQYGTEVVGSYIIQNNRWGTSATQCIETTDSGFRITQQDGTASTSGAPVSYPSIFLGCHYSTCSPGFSPVRLGDMSAAPSTISYSYVAGATYDAAYDIWLNATTDVSTVQDTEIMIWFDRQGSIQPIGSQVGTTTLEGRTWEVWQGSNGSNDVVSYVSPTTLSSLTFDAAAFIRDTMSRGLATDDWYLTSIQAGFEPWIGGAGLAVTDFDVSVTTGDSTPPTTTPATTTATSTTTSAGTTTSPTATVGEGDCSAAITVVNDWGSGYQGQLVVTAGSAGVSGWTVELALNGATIQNSWNGTFSGSTVTNLDWNANLASGQQATAGFIASGGVPQVVSCA